MTAPPNPCCLHPSSNDPSSQPTGQGPWWPACSTLPPLLQLWTPPPSCDGQLLMGFTAQPLRRSLLPHSVQHRTPHHTRTQLWMEAEPQPPRYLLLRYASSSSRALTEGRLLLWDARQVRTNASSRRVSFEPRGESVW